MFIVDKCNFTCPYCYNRKPRHLVEADSDIFVKFLKDVRKHVGDRPINVTFIGGEPTLHSNLDEFSKNTLSIPNLTLELLTNFSRPLDEYMKYLEMGIKIAASWHRAPNDPKNWDYVEKMKKIPMKYFLKDQIEVRIMMENDNWENSRKVFYELYPLYKKYIEISLLSQNDGKPYSYTDKQLKEFENLIILTKYKREFFTVVFQDGHEEQVSFNDMYLNPQVNFHLWKCNAGLDYFYVHVNGDVYNCQSFYEHNRKKLYNIVENGGCLDVEKFKPCICSVEYCSCDYDVMKEKIIGKG